MGLLPLQWAVGFYFYYTIINRRTLLDDNILNLTVNNCNHLDSNKLNPTNHKNKAEKAFHKALEDVELLKKQLATTEALAEKYLENYTSKLYPIHTRYGYKLSELAMILELRSHRWNLSKSELQTLTDTIIGILKYASYWVDSLSEEAQLLWNQYSESTISEYLSTENSNEDTIVHNETDPSLQQQEESDKSNYQTLKKEAKDKIDLKKLRAIYIRLAKILHPDKQFSDQDALTSESEMKEVITAYKNKDIVTLLNLEMKYIAKQSKIAVDHSLLQTYTSTLRKQIKSLRIELNELKSNPRYTFIKNYLDIKEETLVLSKMNKELSTHKKAIRDIDLNLQYIRATKQKKDFIHMIEIIDNDFNTY